jgi:hypothetical protein
MKSYQNLKKLENFEAYNPTQAQLRAAAAREVIETETLTKKQWIASWICRVIAAAIMIETLFFKFTAAPESVYIFRKMGTDPWWRWGQGIWELLAAACLLTPRLGWAGGILTTGAMTAAILSHMTWLGFTILGDHGLLFSMALITFTTGFAVMMLHRHAIPFVSPMRGYSL